MSIWFAPVNLETLGTWQRDTMMEYLGIAITAIGDDWIEGTMPVDRRTHQPHGILHGGASVVLAETLGSYGASLVLDQAKRRAVGQEVSASHLRPVYSGLVVGRARPIHLGGRSQVWNIEIRNQDGQPTCVSRLTMAVIDVR
jgi:1,4-dihydroxy-2-naphthoyl-CoA hydrolase